MSSSSTDLKTATLASGCYWCAQAVLQRVKGVESAVSGFAGGTNPDVTYMSIHLNNTGEAEAVQIQYDEDIISFKEILEIFFATHDPTDAGGQGYDRGPQYRSAIFFHSDEQKKVAEEVIQELNSSEKYDKPIVTEINEFTKFMEASEEQQNFYNNNIRPSYCRIIIDPKIKKLVEGYGEKVKEEYIK